MRIADEQRRRTADDAPWDDPARHHSAWMAVLEDSAGALLVGCLDGRTPRLRADTAVGDWTFGADLTARSARWSDSANTTRLGGAGAARCSAA